jgi:hypothetical protein
MIGLPLNVAEIPAGIPTVFAGKWPSVEADRITRRIAGLMKFAEISGSVAVLEFLGELSAKLGADLFSLSGHGARSRTSPAIAINAASARPSSRTLANNSA